MLQADITTDKLHVKVHSKTITLVLSSLKLGWLEGDLIDEL